jgi:hypothetical protein
VIAAYAARFMKIGTSASLGFVSVAHGTENSVSVHDKECAQAAGMASASMAIARRMLTR